MSWRTRRSRASPSCPLGARAAAREEGRPSAPGGRRESERATAAHLSRLNAEATEIADDRPMRPSHLIPLVLLACEVPGVEWSRCVVEGSILSPTYRCEAGLVCNVALVRCQRPNTGALGERCSSDAVCTSELWCPPGLDAGCAARISEGGECSAGVGCVDGLRCLKADGGTRCAP